MAKILIIEDELAIRNVLSNIIQEEDSSYEVELAENGVEGLEKITNNSFDLVLCDIKMPKMDGIDLLTKAMEIQPELTLIMISGHGDIDTAVDCIKKGAFDYISKPPDLNRLLNTIRNGLDRKNLVVQNKVLKKKVSKKYQMIGNSPELTKIHQMIELVAPTDARVLITGANGTGKELIAHAIHEKSERSKSPMIEVNCAAIPSELIESELFGHEKGAFTSAIKQRKGKFETADTGTLFLDEVGDMSLKAQAKVLRALQEHKITRVGSDKEIKVNVRVLAATNKDLQNEIKEGNFREDLYHRLGVILINNPSLDERKEDIPVLTEHFNKQICKEHGIAEKTFSPDALKTLQSYSWSGNIREFRNVIERLIILCSDTVSKKDVKSFAGKE
ncbi:sigma-54 dependent transcriptional regulator [Flavobacteriales bacterium]|nr:sigma-54 dependent transcriptional regulator [Flavobacteriales bacterium]MDG1146126.1 sigma-54 dependent transcriptional regulator [Flavobacteriales bacterium]MDG1396097.1 sigma-54 dependent transcriptional regulator [Flavobacteriales bacterium]